MPGAIKKTAAAVAGVAALAVGGAAIANAATSGGTTTTTTSAAPTPRPPFPPHGSPAHENAEKPVTGADADKAKAAAVKAVGGGTAGDVTTDCMQNGYEVTVTKSDGSTTEVHLDSSFAVLQGGPHGNGPHGNGPHGNGPPPAGPPPAFG